MKLLGQRAWVLMTICILFSVGMLILLYTYVSDAGTWATYPVNQHLYRSGRLIGAGTIYDRNGVALASTENGKRHYNDSTTVRKALMHLTGDSDGNVATGLQVSYRKTLTGWNFFTGAYSYDGKYGNNITTTVDASLCRMAYEAMDGRRGTVGVMNYKTGELLCMISTPTFDPADPPNVADNPEKFEGVYINRLLSSSFTPGSIFKLVTAMAAIENVTDLSERSFTCNGVLELDGGRITCPSNHGTQDFGQMLTNSCNCAFARLAIDIGADKLYACAERAGFNRTDMRLDDIHVSGGSFTLDGANESELGWAGVGQYRTLLNPLSYLQFIGSIANGGERVSPHIVKSVDGSLNRQRAFGSTSGASMSRETAERLGKMMRNNVLNNYGEGHLSDYKLCGKTGTAEVGGDKSPHSWFTGFLDSEAAPLCVIVLIENGGSGRAAALGVARQVLDKAITLTP